MVAPADVDAGTSTTTRETPGTFLDQRKTTIREETRKRSLSLLEVNLLCSPLRQPIVSDLVLMKGTMQAQFMTQKPKHEQAGYRLQQTGM